MLSSYSSNAAISSCETQQVKKQAFASFSGSPHEGGEPGTFYHVYGIKGTHNLITWGWTKPEPTHIQVQAFSQSCFWVDSFSVLASSFQSVTFSCSHNASRFLESVSTTRSTATLAYTCKKPQNFLPNSLSGAKSRLTILQFVYSNIHTKVQRNLCPLLNSF